MSQLVESARPLPRPSNHLWQIADSTASPALGEVRLAPHRAVGVEHQFLEVRARELQRNEAVRPVPGFAPVDVKIRPVE
jgi:hypothetical protein